MAGYATECAVYSGTLRSGGLALVGKRQSLQEQDTQYIWIYLLSAGFVGCLLGLLIAMTVYQIGDYLLVLLALFGAAGVYHLILDSLLVTRRPVWPPPCTACLAWW